MNMRRLVVLLLLAASALASVQLIHVNVDKITDLCIFDKYLVVVGGKMALFLDGKGQVVKTLELGKGDGEGKCAVLKDKLYLAYRIYPPNDLKSSRYSGNTSLYVVGKDLTVLNILRLTLPVTALAADFTHVYLAGAYVTNETLIWWIEKRDENLSLVKAVTIRPRMGEAVYGRSWPDYPEPRFIHINNVTGRIWIAGFYLSINVLFGYIYTYIEFLNSTTLEPLNKSLLVWRILSGLCSDRSGNTYAVFVPSYAIVKFDVRGNITGRLTDYDPRNVWCSKDRIYVIGFRGENDVVAVYDTNLNLLDRYEALSTLKMIVFGHISKPAFDGFRLYLAPSASGGDILVVPVVWPLRVVDLTGRPLGGVLVRAVTINRTVDAVTNSSGTVLFEHVFPLEYKIYGNGFLVAVSPAAFNATVKLDLRDSFPLYNSPRGRGYLVLKGVELANGSKTDVVYAVEFADGAAKVHGVLSMNYTYPVELYLTHVSLGGREVALRRPVLVYKGYATALAKGLDLAELGLAGVVRASAVDSSGAVRGDWAVEVLYNGTVVARGNGTLAVALPRTSLVGQPYTLRVVTTAKGPDGRPYAVAKTLAVENATVPTAVRVNTTRVVVAVVDGFGRQRSWPVEVVGVASGNGSLAVELVEGGRYTARASALGFTNATEFTAVGREVAITLKIPTAVVKARAVDGFGQPRSWPVEVAGAAGNGSVVAEVLAAGSPKYVVKAYAFGREFAREVEVSPGREVEVEVKVPTAKIAARVVDGFGQPRDWPIEVVGVASGRGAVGPVEVLAGNYTVRATAFGREFVQQAVVGVGQVAEVAVRVPTARLSVAVVDNEGKPLDRYVAGVELAGPLSMSFDKPPRDVEVLAGQYVVKATALGKSAAVNVTVAPGEAREVKMVVPGTAGIDVGDTRITYGTLAVVAVVIAAAVGAIAYLAKRKK